MTVAWYLDRDIARIHKRRYILERDPLDATNFAGPLVNRKGDVIRIYDALKPSELEQLTRDVRSELKN